jgi:DNA-directed RNA polymerase specialized sigma24 family protein
MHALRPTPKIYSDVELFEMLSRSTPEAQQGLALLYDRYSQRIFTYCRKITGSSVVAEDLLQETFTRCNRKKSMPQLQSQAQGRISIA